MDKTIKFKKLDWALPLLLALIVTCLNLIWFFFDYRFPSQDEAEHIINSLTFKDLLMQARPLRLHWWYQCMTVNCFYPPFVYAINGLCLLLFGQARFVEQLAVTLFAVLLVIAVYNISRLLSGTPLVACVAALCVCFYPAISTLSHTFFLELPEIAMLALALMMLLWWNSRADLKWWHTILTAFILGLACLSKQLVAAYLLPVGLYLLFLHFFLHKERKKIVHILVMGCLTTLMGLPFILINYQASKNLAVSLMQDTAAKHIHLSYLNKLGIYIGLLPSLMSPFLLIVFLIAICFLWRKRTFFPLAISALGGLFLICAMPGFSQDYRYLAPFLIAPAVYTGFFVGDLLSSKKIWQRILGLAVSLFAMANYFFFNFIPYPLDYPPLPWQANICDHDGNPQKPNDWGHSLVIETIEKVDKDKLVYLNVLTNMGTLHGHAFELLLKERGNKYIKPTSSRFFTIVGDKVQFSPDTALNYQWYLWKTGSVGYYFYDRESERNFAKLVDYIRNGGEYKLMVEKELPDNSKLMLYRRKF